MCATTQTLNPCRACGAEHNSVWVRYCTRCGAAMPPLSCTECGTVVTMGARFCHNCGKALPAIAATMPTAIEERKTVTVLFADLRGSTWLISGHDPEQAIELLELAIGVMRESVHRFGGVVTRIMGDGLMALFGAPHAQEQHASFACRAALAMSGAVRGLSTRWVASTPAAAASNPEILLRIGLHSGEVVFRPVRNDFVEDWDASGEVVAIAARMEQMAQPGEVWATATTLHLVRGGIIAHSLGARPVKGLKQPVEIFRLDGVDQWRSRLQISAERHGLSTFITRGPELAILGDALTHARAGEGRVVALVADAGCGKSRLSREFGIAGRG